MRRKLTDEEAHICKRNLGFLDKKEKKLDRRIKYFTLMVDEGGLQDSFDKQRDEYEAERKEIVGQITNIRESK